MFWRSIIFQNYRAKIALLLMAVFLWFFVVSSKEYVQVLRVPVCTLNLQPDKVFLKAPPTYAQVRFRGRGTSLILLALFGDAHINLDLAAAKSSQNFHLTLDQVHWASSIDVQAMEIVPPDTIRIQLGDRQAERKDQGRTSSH